MARRLSHLWGQRQTIALLLLTACACHFTLQITEQYNVPLTGLSLILTVYLGYKGGRWLGFAAGVATTAPWTIRAIFVLQGTDRWARLLWGDLRYPLLPRVPLRVEGASLQFLIQAALLGWFTGWGFDWVESRLSEHQLSLGYLFPGIKQAPLEAPGKPLLQVFYGSLERWVLSIVGDGDSNTREVAGETPRRRKPLPLPPSKLLVLPLLIFLVVCNARISALFPDLEIAIAFPPGYLAAVLVLAFAFIAGSARGIWMGLAVWAISLAQSFTPSFLFSSDQDGPSILSRVSIESVPQAVGLVILAWWVGKVGELFRDQEKRRRLGALWTSCKNVLSPRPRPSLLMFPVFAILTVGIGFSVGCFHLTYNPYVLLFLAASLFGYYRDPVAVSNRVFVLFLLIATVVQYYSLSPGLMLLMTPHDFYALVLVSLTPLIVGWLDLSRSANCRAAALGFLIALAVRDLFLGGGHFEFSLDGLVLRPDFTFYDLLIVCWVLHVLIFLVAASFLHWIVRRWPAAQPPGP